MFRKRGVEIFGKGEKKNEKIKNFFSKNPCKIKIIHIYYKSLPKAMKREVAELSGNSRGELSPLDGGEGIRWLLLCVKNKGTHGDVYRQAGFLETGNKNTVHVEKAQRNPLYRYSVNVQKNRRN